MSSIEDLKEGLETLRDNLYEYIKLIHETEDLDESISTTMEKQVCKALGVLTNVEELIQYSEGNVTFN